MITIKTSDRENAATLTNQYFLNDAGASTAPLCFIQRKTTKCWTHVFGFRTQTFYTEMNTNMNCKFLVTIIFLKILQIAHILLKFSQGQKLLPSLSTFREMTLIVMSLSLFWLTTDPLLMPQIYLQQQFCLCEGLR